MSETKTQFREEHLMKLQGKDYLPVAPRVVLFRAEHPEYSIITETKEIAGDTYVCAAIVNPAGYTLAMAHKRVRKDAKGPAALWPLETAETGAIGRALALCGYGTLAGDLDEGDELADAPVEKVSVDAKGARGKAKRAHKAKPAVGDVPAEQSMEQRLDAVKTKAEFDALYKEALAHLDTLEEGSDEFEFVKAAGVRAKKRVGA